MNSETWTWVCTNWKRSVYIYTHICWYIVLKSWKKLENLQCRFNYIYNWCTNLRMSLNSDKTKIVDFRNKRQCQTKSVFTFGAINLYIVSQYRYIGLVLNEFIDLGITANILSDSAGYALGTMIAKTINPEVLGFKMHQKLFNTGGLAKMLRFWCSRTLPALLVFKREQLGIISVSTNII